ncbi:hypothetical protein LTR36_009682 [Oleoguttula mirabilis]|uniref:Protein-S-isoprenylcysteine O-methyltransferase n=1 Tax=Oleoguttula mirabilis TaxID=1507867 RepID=A0AAV9J5W2_9PEZI|nr:hypothetical protein LTR36_009682 [Oleoguttula mirabilis]
MTVLDVLYLAALLQQLYAFAFHFHRPANGHRASSHWNALVLLSGGCTISTALPLLQARPTLDSFTGIFSVLSLTSGILLFTWAAFTSRPGRFRAIFGEVKPAEVVSHGPYAYVRHPTYTSYALAWTGAIAMDLATGPGVKSAVFWAACACFAGLLWLYQKAAEQEEAAFLTDATRATSESYKAYRQHVTARWVPGVG